MVSFNSSNVKSEYQSVRSWITCSTRSLYELATEYITNSLDRLTDSEIKERVECYDEELYDELVDNVTQQYPKQLNIYGG